MRQIEARKHRGGQFRNLRQRFRKRQPILNIVLTDSIVEKGSLANTNRVFEGLEPDANKARLLICDLLRVVGSEHPGNQQLLALVSELRNFLQKGGGGAIVKTLRP